MKKILLPLLVACVLALPTRAQTVLTVDVQGVFSNLTEVKTEIAKLSSSADSYRGYLQDMLTKINDLKKNVDELQIQANNQAISPDSREAYKKEAISKNDQLLQMEQTAQSFQNTSNGQIQDKQQALVKTELEKIRQVVKQIATEKKSTLVINSSDMAMLSSVLYSGTSLDISNDVIKKLNDDYNTLSATAATPATGTAAPAMGTAKPASTTK